MTILKLYTGNGKSYSLKYEDGMHESDEVRVFADEGKILSLDGDTFYCRDISRVFVENIQELPDDGNQWNELQ